MKKRISLMIAVVMIMTHLLSIVSFADFSDVKEDNPYRQAIITLTKLGIINGYEEEDKTFTFRPEGEITRAEFTKMLITALGRGGYTTEPTEFSDIDGHWARYNIKAAYDMKIINGFDDGTFRPDEQVTYEQALKMVVCTLGYIDFAEGKGGWPNGYTTQANELKLTKGITGQKNSEPALRQVIAQVVYNALEVKKMEKNIKGEYELTDKTILNDDLKVYKLEGKIVGVEGIKTDDCTSSLLDYQMAFKVGAAEHIIDVRDYKELSVAGLQQYVGKQATVYYALDKASDVKTLVILDTETVDNTTYEISYEDIVSFNGTELKYYEKDAIRAKTLKLNLNNVTAVYNGETLNSVDTYELYGKDATAPSAPMGKIAAVTELLNPTSEHFIYGDVELTDSGSDGTIDMAIISDYRWMIAHKTVSKNDYTVQNTFVTSETLTLDPNNVYEKVYVEENGKEVEATAISKGDVVTYTMSFDGTVKRAYVSKQTVKGEVTSLSTDKISIDGKEYNLDSKCVQYMKKNGYSVNVGSNVTMYFDKLGTVIYGVVAVEAAIPYGYIANVTEDQGEGVTYLQAFIPSYNASKISSLKVSSSVIIDGSKVTNATEVKNRLAAAAGGKNNSDVSKGIPAYTPVDTSYSQVARIKVDKANKEVTEIITLDSTAPDAENTDKSRIVRYWPVENFSYNSNRFTATVGSTKKSFSINSSTVIIDVPEDRTPSDGEGYAKRTSSNFTANTNYWVEAYDVNKSLVAGLVIRYAVDDASLGTKHTIDSQHSIIGGYANDVSDDGETLVTKVPLYSGSKNATNKEVASTLASSKDVFNANYSIGDIIQFSTNEDNQIKEIDYVLNYEDDIKPVLEGALTDGKKYDWTEEVSQSETNRWQKYKFDFRYPKTGLSSPTENFYDKYDFQGYAAPLSSATMYNVVRVVEGENQIFVTKDGIADDADRELTDYTIANNGQPISISSSVNILKFVPNGVRVNNKLEYFTQYEEDGTTPLSVDESFKSIEEYGEECSKIMISIIRGSIKMIVIYQ